MNRLTKRGAVSQRDINNLLEYSNDNQTGRNDAYYKLQYYEDLEEQGKLTILPYNNEENNDCKCKECMINAPYRFCCKIECGEHEFCKGCNIR